MNTFPDRNSERRWSLTWVLGGLIGLCLASNAQALDPGRSLSDYVHDRWGIEQGFPGGPVYAITQTADGYLWIGAEKGLVRFDGLSFKLFSHANSPALPDGPVLDLMTDSEGNVWIRPQSRDMVRYRDGVFQDVMADLDSTHSGVTAMCRGPKSEVLFAVRAAGTFLYGSGRFEKLASTAERPNFLVISMAVNGDGKVWMGTRDAGLFLMSEGLISAAGEGLPDRKINCLLAVDDRQLWIGTDNGVVRRNGEGEAGTSVLDQLDRIQALAMTRDRDSNIWIGTGNGLLRLNTGGVASTERSDRASTSAVNAILEDREGNLWVGSTRGLERLRDS